MCPSLIEIGS